MSEIHHRPLPPRSGILAGRGPIRDDHGYRTDKLQIWFNDTDRPWTDERSHAHEECDECFIVTRGAIVVDVEGEEHRIGPREFCVFPAGVFHRIVRVETPVESFMIRAPSVDDKRYR